MSLFVRIVSTVALTVALLVSHAPAQNNTAVPAPPATPAVPLPAAIAALLNDLPTVEQIEARIALAKESKDLSDDMKAKIESQYRETVLRAMTSARSDAEQIAAYESLLAPGAASATEQVKGLRATLEGLPKEASSVTDDLPADATLAALEQKLADEQLQLTNLRSQLALVDKTTKDLQDRPAQRAAELTLNTQKLAEIDAALKLPAPDGEPAMLTEARTTGLRARRAWRTIEQRKLELESTSFDARQQLATAQHDLVTKQMSLATARVDAIRKVVDARRIADAAAAQRAAAAAQAAAKGKGEVVESIAALTAQYSAERVRTEAQKQSVGDQKTEIAARLARTEQSFKSDREKLEAVGLSGEMGQELRDKASKLPDLQESKDITAKREQTLASARFRYLQIDDLWQDLGDIDAATERVMSEKVSATLPDEEREALREEVRKQLVAQKDVLTELKKTYEAYRQSLADLLIDETRSLERAQEYKAFLDERLLWTPSGDRIGLRTFENAAEALRDILRPSEWTRSTVALGGAIKERPLTTSILAALLLGLLITHQRWRRLIREAAEHVADIDTDRYGDAIVVLASTVLLVAPIPLLLWSIGWLLQQAPADPDYNHARAIGQALRGIGIFVLLVQFVRSLCRDHNLCGAHFRWRDATRGVLRNQLLLLLVMGVPASILIAYSSAIDREAHSDSLGRLAFMAAEAVLALVLARIFHPGEGVVAMIVARQRKGWFWRFRYIIFVLAFGLPLAFVALAGFGYYHTALQLARRLFGSLCLALAALIIHDLVVRWLAVAAARLAMQKAQEKREAAESESTSARAPDESAGGSLPPTREQSTIDLARINVHTRQMVRMAIGIGLLLGLWSVWSSVLPALGILDDVHVWTIAEADGDSPARYVTLANLALAVIGISMTVALARNLPGVLEILVLQKLSVDQGTRYAIATIFQYLIVAFGVIFTANQVGIDWSKVQWLVAALGVGLGFGLQEIFANFISGIIILFERPVRIGDIVTIGDISGVVSRIQIRATTITGWDRKELLVPNKEFVTGRVLNWTLSDSVNRITINVGIAYGSDTDRARDILMRICNEHPLVLKDPPTRVTFEGFGDSTLNFVVRAHLPDLENRLNVIHELHTSIDKAFRQAGIEIAFPQRDLHIRSIQAPLQLHSDDVTGGPQAANAADTHE